MWSPLSLPVRSLAAAALSALALHALVQVDRSAALDPPTDVPAVRTPGPWGASIDEFLAQDRARPPSPGGVVVIGSSSVRLWDLDRAFPTSGIVMRGFGGSLLADSVRHAQALILPHRPRSVVVYAGENDLAGGTSPQQVLERYLGFVEKVHAVLPQTRIVFVSIKPSPVRHAILPAIREANALVAAHARTDPRLGFVDVHDRMLDGQGLPRPELFQQDMLHLNDAGYRIWNAAVAPQLR